MLMTYGTSYGPSPSGTCPDEAAISHKSSAFFTLPRQQDQNVRQQGRRRVETGGGTDRTLCGPFAGTMDLGERKNPSSTSDLR